MLKITAETNKTEKIQQRNSMKLKVSSLKRLTKLTNFVRWNKKREKNQVTKIISERTLLLLYKNKKGI